MKEMRTIYDFWDNIKPNNIHYKVNKGPRRRETERKELGA